MDDKDNNPFAQRQRKEHKTLSSKLRKKRQQLKKHKKQKKLRKEQYARDEKRKQFFEQSKGTKRDATKDSYGVRLSKLKSLFRKFITVYEDQLEDFYDIWAAIDQGGTVDIMGVEDQNVKQCLKSLMQCLGLQNTKEGFRKTKRHKEMNIRNYVKLRLQQVMQDYIENGTVQSESDSVPEKKEVLIKAVKTMPNSTDKQQQPKAQPQPSRSVGPFISQQQRQLMQKMLEQSCKIEQEVPQPIKKVDSRIAKGSGQIAQRTQQEAAAFMVEYNKKYRNSSLLEQHRQTLEQNKKNKNSELTDMLRGALFFDFKDKLVKPKDNQSFM